ncbi:MAG: flagellar hook-basal body complex protein [Planctomycetes bacterium]|nr:flagellar hook-basal body complex protein [Planctomycetota bacterium]
MSKLAETVAKVCLGTLCVAAIATSTLIVKARYDLSVATQQARLGVREADSELRTPGAHDLHAFADESDSVRSDREAAILNSLIEQEFGDLSPEEREIWSEGLRGRSPQDVREILAMRRQFEPRGIQIVDDYQFLSADSEPPRALTEDSIATANPMPAESKSLMSYSLEALQTAEQILLNNIANAGTVGFKRTQVLFSDRPYRPLPVATSADSSQPPRGAGATAVDAPGMRLGSGTTLGVTRLDLTPGELRHTKQPLDLAIQGAGFFQVSDGDRCFYTRVGAFQTDTEGYLGLLTAKQFRRLQPELRLPVTGRPVSIAPDGTVTATEDETALTNTLGQLQLATFSNGEGLQACGEGLFERASGSGEPVLKTPGSSGCGELRQGYLEGSNVILSDELAELHRLRELIQALRTLQHEPSPGAPTLHD